MNSRNRVINYLTITSLLASVLVFVAACGSETKKTPPAAEVAKKEYRVQPGDVLFISVWREETLQREVIVQPDGAIRFPLAGEVAATGLSLAQIEQTLKKQLSDYIPDPALSVSLLKSLGNRIYVVGRVNAPGEYVLTRNVDVLQALALARGMTPFAKKKKIRILRQEEGQRRSFHFNYKEVENGERLSQNILLIPGDTVVVP